MKSSFLTLLTLLSFFCLSAFWGGVHEARACNTTSSFQLSDCDSVVSPSGKYTWKFHGVYMDTIPNMGGCDSIMTINVRVNTVNAVIQAGLGNTLVAYPDSAKYLWIYCNAFDTLSTSQNFYPPGVGYYRVIVDFQGCLDTSDCVYHTLGSVGSITEKGYSVYPNPANAYVTISSEIPILATIRTINGQVIAKYEESELLRINTQFMVPGTYLLEIQSPLGRYTEKLVVIHE